MAQRYTHTSVNLKNKWSETLTPLPESIEIFTEKPDHFIPQVEVAAVYLQLDGKTLFLQRSGSERGYWGVPAGKIENNENPLQGALRELAEETGFVLPDESKMVEVRKLYMKKPSISYIYHMFSVELTSQPRISLSKEHLNFGWFSSEEVKTLPLMAGALEAYQALCSWI